MMPSRLLIRNWLATKTRDQIITELGKINAEHGFENEQDVRDILNHERKAFASGKELESPAEKSLLSDHEEWKAKVKADLEFKKQLHRDTKTQPD